MFQATRMYTMKLTIHHPPFILTRTTRATSQVMALSGIVVFVVVQVHEDLFMVQECVMMFITLMNKLIYT